MGIATETEFKSWLESQPEATRQAIAARSALRAFPALLYADRRAWEKSVLATGRAILTAAVAVASTDAASLATILAARSVAKSAAGTAAGTSLQSSTDSTADLAALSAARSSTASDAFSATASAASSAGFSIDAATGDDAAAELAAAATFAAAFADADRVGEAPVDLFKTLLWHGQGIAKGLAENWARFTNGGGDIQPEWVFWRDWYQGFLDGNPLDWELQHRVALIREADWGQGAQHIAREIDTIKAELLAERLPLAETVEINPDTGLFRVVPIAVQNPVLIGALLSHVRDAVEDAVRGNNGLNSDSLEVRVLTRTVERYGNDPQRIEMDFTSVAVGLRRQIHETQELPGSEDNLALLAAVEGGALGIRATHSDVAQNRTVLVRQAMLELSAAEKEQLIDAGKVLESLSEGQMADDFAADIPALVASRENEFTNFAPLLPGMDPASRVGSRAAKMSLVARTSETVSAIDGSAPIKAIKFGKAVFDLSQFLSWLLGLFY